MVFQEYHLSFFRIKLIKRPIEPRIDEDNISTVLDVLGAGLLIKVFASLLLERKVIIVGHNMRFVLHVYTKFIYFCFIR